MLSALRALKKGIELVGVGKVVGEQKVEERPQFV
jgi:hypothetical protein